ncbi:hypothetical protein STEG23_019729, partial [Scotinomys teguina]
MEGSLARCLYLECGPLEKWETGLVTSIPIPSLIKLFLVESVVFHDFSSQGAASMKKIDLPYLQQLSINNSSFAG